MLNIIMLGIGVVGLTTATLLLNQKKEIKVHLVAKHFSEDLSDKYMSTWYIILSIYCEVFKNVDLFIQL